MAEFNDKKLTIATVSQMLLFIALFAFQLSNSALYAADTVPMLISEGEKMLDAWLNTGASCDGQYWLDASRY